MRARADDEPEESGVERTCVVSRVKGAPDAMLRFVLDPAGVVTPDLRRKLPGRGVWIAASADLVRKAQAKGIFARAFKRAAQAPATLAADVDSLIERQALQALSLANKAGLVTVGFSKVETAIAKGAARALIHAGDGAPDGARKLGQALARAGVHETTPRVRIFSGVQLDLALGRPNVIHAALEQGAAGDALLSRCRLLALYRGAPQAYGADAIQEFEPGGAAAPAFEVEAGAGPGTANV